jgi:cell wall-associated NlpC family hydrolase/N-acetylmuramoyl-L-alanine amidase/putative cell wall-binding protein
MRLTRRTVCALLGVLAFLTIFAIASGSVFATTFYSTNTSTSVGNAVGNALTLSGKAYPSGAPAAVVTNADDWTKGAAASVLAHAYGGPLLLSSSTSLTAGVASELKRLNPAAVYVVGLPATVAAQIDAALAGLPLIPQVVALTGADAYETAALVARQLKVKLGTISKVVIVPIDYSGGVLAGSTMAAANGWPVLLTPAAGPLPQASADAIAELGATLGICVGTAVNPSISGFSVEKSLTGTISGADGDGRFSLCAKVADYAVTSGYLSYDHVGMVESYDRTGGLVASTYLADGAGVLFLSPNSGLPASASSLIQAHGREISEVNVIGLAWSVVRQIKSLNAPRVTVVSPNTGPVAGGTKVVVTGTGLDTASAVTIGKTAVPSTDWKADSSTQLTILSAPQAAGSGPAEVIVQNYWNRSPATVKGLYKYTDGGPALPGDRVVTEALKYVGVPYVWAGASPTGGFDCSGLTMYVYKQLGFALPHYSAAQAGYGTAVSKDALLPGDLVFFSSPISHVGIYVGGGLMINAPRSGDLVTLENVNRSSFATARRIYTPYTRYQDNNALLTTVGSWGTSGTTTASGGSFRWLNSGGLMTVKFNGNYLAWIARTGPQYGIAKVSVDGGTPVTVDLYSALAQNQKSVWNTGMLGAGDHTVTIAWTGTKNTSATACTIAVDAFDLIGSLVRAPGPVRYQQSDTHLAYAGIWSTRYSTYASGGSFFYALSPATVTMSFDGTYLAWIAEKGPVSGRAQVTLDGGSPVTVDLYRSGYAGMQLVYNTGILEDAPHTLTIAWTGTKNAAATNTLIGVDAFDVLGELTDATAVPPGPIITRYEQTDPKLGYIGSWGTSSSAEMSSGDGTYANSASRLVVGFKGTSLSWIAKKSSVYGIAKVTLDDKAPVEVDLYSPTPVFQQSVYQTGELADGNHTLTIEWTGTKNAAASDYNVGADAFDIVGQLIQAPSPTRYEENSSQIAYAGKWQPNSWGVPSSGGRSVFTNTPESSATISFDGTYICWVTKKSPLYGKAMVSLDGAAPVVVDLYNPTEVWQQRAWNSGILPAGPHTLTIQWSWGRSRIATDTNVCLDAVEIVGTLTQATANVMHSEPKLVVVDPGHQLYANNALEPVGPGSTTMKAKVSSGTASCNTGSPESALVLKVGLKLRASLESYGLDVVMTRDTQSVDISNAERAQMANAAGADLFVRIHADGSTDPAVNGILMLYPATIAGWTDEIAAESLRGATIAQQEMVKATGAKSRGLSARSDLAGFNWSDVPTFLPEMGLMTNPAEDKLLATDAYQNKLVSGLTKAILCFLNVY